MTKRRWFWWWFWLWTNLLFLCACKLPETLELQEPPDGNSVRIDIRINQPDHEPHGGGNDKAPEQGGK